MLGQLTFPQEDVAGFGVATSFSDAKISANPQVLQKYKKIQLHTNTHNTVTSSHKHNIPVLAGLPAATVRSTVTYSNNQGNM